jgi:hypothetical protein
MPFGPRLPRVVIEVGRNSEDSDSEVESLFGSEGEQEDLLSSSFPQPALSLSVGGGIDLLDLDLDLPPPESLVEMIEGSSGGYLVGEPGETEERRDLEEVELPATSALLRMSTFNFIQDTPVSNSSNFEQEPMEEDQPLGMRKQKLHKNLKSVLLLLTCNSNLQKSN